MSDIKINFVDFWTGFDKLNNYFFNLLSKKYTIIIDENPDLLFYSCFGEDYLKYDCTRIFYTGENIKPDYLGCDFAFSFQYDYHKKHFRLPLYSLYIDHHNMLNSLQTIENKAKAIEIWKNKSNFLEEYNRLFVLCLVFRAKKKRRLHTMNQLFFYE